MANNRNKSTSTDSKPVEKKEGKTYVVSQFRDKNDYDTVYLVDQDVSDLEEDRLEELKAKGLVETFVKPEPAK
ncbi:hypothetical protein GCM10028806_28490 [Spirosoma terrae]|uniref:Uncharacterized protein n=1 Tax=Spirosoma terrae TaxID=1968276 RepID=A0A6L9LDI2_9BACT|nr:hypothetical protein [Spirosoma terrae]NDU97191.1 hypothetical protein [Spirosoma terrae]